MPTSVPRLIVIAEESSQRLAFGEAIKACGYELMDCVPSDRINESFLQAQPDLWLIDAKDDIHIIEKLQKNDRFLLGFTPAPHITNIKAFGKWQRSLKRKLHKVLGEPPSLMPTPPSSTDTKQLSITAPSLKSVFKPKVKEAIEHTATHEALDTSNTDKVTPQLSDYYFKTLLVLGASFGGPKAVKEFLDALPCDLPLRVVLAQHIDAKAAQALPDVLTRNNAWQCKVLKEAEKMQKGVVYILSSDKKTQFMSDGVKTTDTPWEGQYKPCISDIMLSASEVLAQRVLHIIFSGMGDDGASAAAQVTSMGSEIWAQSPPTAVCSSQPAAIIETGHVGLIASPTEMAMRVIERLTPAANKTAS